MSKVASWLLGTEPLTPPGLEEALPTNVPGEPKGQGGTGEGGRKLYVTIGEVVGMMESTPKEKSM